MTNKQFKKHCKYLFNRLDEATQRAILHMYAMDEFNFSDTKAKDFSFQTMKPKRYWPEIYHRYAGRKAKNKIYLWHYNNCVMPQWQHAHFEIVSYIRAEEHKEKSGVVKLMFDNDSYTTYHLSGLSHQWADKFTDMYVNYDWNKHGDYDEKLIGFCNEENQKFEQYATS